MLNIIYWMNNEPHIYLQSNKVLLTWLHLEMQKLGGNLAQAKTPPGAPLFIAK